MNLKNYIFLLLLSAALFVSCQKDAERAGEEEIVFRTEDNWGDEETVEAARTKGSQKEGFVDGDRMGVYAFWSESGSMAGGLRYFTDQEVDYDGTSWSYAPKRYYPETGELFFRAYYPLTTSENGITPSATSNSMTITYQTPVSPVNQPDLMVAKVDNKSTGDVGFHFSHILAAIKFVVGDKMTAGFAMTKIEISGITTTGTYNYSTWTPSTTGTVYHQATGSAKLFESTGSEAPGTEMFPECFMLIPQTCAAGAQVTVYYQQKVDSVYYDMDPVSFSLKGFAFEMAESYSFRLNYSGEVLATSASSSTGKGW